MRKELLVVLTFAAVMAGCASAKTDSGLGHAKANLIEPEIAFTQLNLLPQVARQITGNVPVHYRVRVANKSAEPITLMRLDVRSLGQGAYTLEPQSHPFKTKIEPDHFEVVEFWMPAYIDDPTVYGANGPVTLRAVAHFDSPVGQFDQVVVQQVHDHPSDETKPQ
jgi:hypothetical protein